MSDRHSLKALVQGEDVVMIAQRLLGATLSTHIDGVRTSGIIVETEAYKAPEDKGSHAYGNKRTKRTETLFAKAGTAYVYLCYGIHHLFNIVTGPEDIAHAVLVRAVEPNVGLEEIKKRRSVEGAKYQLTNGPGKLSKALAIITKYNGYDLLSKDDMISINLCDNATPKSRIIASPRVGIGYAEEDAILPWRFRVKDNPWTSLPHEVSYD